MQLIHKLFKKEVVGKENLEDKYKDALVFYDEDFRKVIKIALKEDDIEFYKPLLEWEDKTHVYVKMLDEKNYEVVSEEYYESFKEEHLEEYI